MKPFRDKTRNTLKKDAPRYSSEGVDVPKKKGRPKLERRGGRRPGAVKFPLRSATNKYLAMREDRVKKSTLDNESRILKHLVGVLEEMERQGEMSTCNPWKMSRKDVRAVLDHLQNGDSLLQNETLEKYIRYLEGVLEFCDNHVIQEMKRDSPNLFPRRGRKPIAHLTEDEVKTVQEAAKGYEGWNGSIMRFISAMYPATGLRPSELRQARFDDLNTRDMTIRVSHPKGAGSYGEKRTVSIMPQAEESVRQFLEDRKKHIQSMGKQDSKYLIPNLSGGKDVPYSANHFRKLKKELQEATGINFKLKDYRSTFASLTVQKDPTLIPEVSKQLGHTSIVTTQRFYADMDLVDTGSKLRKAWSEKEKEPDQETNTQKGRSPLKILIKAKEYLPGYA